MTVSETYQLELEIIALRQKLNEIKEIIDFDEKFELAEAIKEILEKK